MTTARAVICVCCARPTGEFRGGDRDVTSEYCDDCRDLPAPWYVNHDETTTTTGLINQDVNAPAPLQPEWVNNGEATRVGGGRLRGVLDFIPPPQPVMEDDEDDEDDEPDRPHCQRCGGTDFFAIYYPAGRIYRTGDTTENEPGDNYLYVEHYEDDTYADNLDRVECRSCGHEVDPAIFDGIEYV